jgi:hypothetical protein
VHAKEEENIQEKVPHIAFWTRDKMKISKRDMGILASMDIS